MGFFDETFMDRNLILVVVFVLVTLLACRLFSRFVPSLLTRHSRLWTEILAKYQVPNYLAHSVPGFQSGIFVQLSPSASPTLASISHRLGLESIRNFIFQRQDVRLIL